ncbi:MAG: hypothetical protein AAF039_04495 [Bacteroidota bacterium]
MKKYVKLALLVFPFVALAQGANSKTFVNSIALEGNSENVWNAITDFSTMNLWDENIVDIRCQDGLAKNSYCKVIVGSGKIFDVEIVELSEGTSYTVRYKLSSGNVYIKRSLESKSVLQLTETVWYTGISKRTFEKYKGEDYATTLKTRMTDFKKYLEEDLAEGR